MVLNYNIQHIKSKELLLADGFATLNKTELFEFLREQPELKTNMKAITDTSCMFYIQDENGVIFERYLENFNAANTIKNKFIKYLEKGRSRFAVFKEKFIELAKGAAYAAHH